MDFKDFIASEYDDKDPSHVTRLIAYMDNEKNFQTLFHYWESLDLQLSSAKSDELYEAIESKIQKSVSVAESKVCHSRLHLLN